jgi:hypothetical protein
MKLLLTLVLVWNYLSVIGQSYEMTYEVVPVQASQTLYLNKKIRLLGKNKNFIEFHLPHNTVSWYYAFGTTVNKEVKKEDNFSLKNLMMGALNKGGQLVLAAASELAKPTGVAAVDVYLLDDYNKTLFMEGNDFRYNSSASRKNLTSGTIKSEMHRSTPLYLCFSNPAATQGVSVHVEIYAYVSKKVYIDEWTNNSKNQLNSYCLKYFAHKTEAIQHLCGCVMDQIVTTQSPKAFLEASSERQELIFKQCKRVCYETTGTVHVEAQDVQIKQLYKDIFGLREVNDYETLVEKYEALVQLGKKDADVYNSLAWYSLLSRQFDKAKSALIAGLGESPNNLFLHGNLAHYYLITGDYKACEAIHLRFKKEALKEDLSWKQMVEQDLLVFEDLDIYHSDFNKVRQLVGLKRGRLAQVFDPRYNVGGKVAFERGQDSYVGAITALDKERGENTLSYQNIYDEPQSIRLSVTKVTPLSDLEYQKRLAAWHTKIARYKYSVGQLGTWQQQKNTLFGRIIQLNNSRHQATLEHQNIYGETVHTPVPYLELTIIMPDVFERLQNDWATTQAQYQFAIGEQVTWTTVNIINGLKTVEQGAIIQLNAENHQAHIRYTNKKGKEKIVRKGYLSLKKVRV